MMTGKDKEYFKKKMMQTAESLRQFNKVLFLTTSNRWSGEKNGEKSKSTMLAYQLLNIIGESKCTLIEVPELKIYPCEGNISSNNGNNCGVLKSVLNDPKKNPSGNHRCWASINNPDDELWKISKQLLESDCVVFFGSVRWGQMNSYYQKLIERLTWLENRHSTLNEDNIIKDISAGIIIVGQNWNGTKVLETQKQVLDFYGFKVNQDLCWLWQYTESIEDESNDSYKKSAEIFYETFINK